MGDRICFVHGGFGPRRRVNADIEHDIQEALYCPSQPSFVVAIVPYKEIGVTENRACLLTVRNDLALVPIE
jgi:hypothetical protein